MRLPLQPFAVGGVLGSSCALALPLTPFAVCAACGSLAGSGASSTAVDFDCFRASPLRLREDASRELRKLVDTLESIDDARSLVHVLNPAL